VIAGADIAAILVATGKTAPEAVTTWLDTAFGEQREE
jgi:hypothetical protein